MKKTITRLMSLLIAVLLLAAMPMTALAAVDIPIYEEYYSSRKPSSSTYEGAGPQIDMITVDDTSVRIKASDYDYFVEVDGVLYERLGVANVSEYKVYDSIIIPPRPTDPIKADEWDSKYSDLFVSYGRHTHVSYGWQASLTNHWRYCVICHETYDMNWHWDYNKDDKCDFCENDIHYYTITIKDMEGGTVTLSQDKAKLNDEVQVTVKPDAGYELKEIRFYNLNQPHSQLVRYEDVPGKEYHFVVLPWDIEIEADFVKVN